MWLCLVCFLKRLIYRFGFRGNPIVCFAFNLALVRLRYLFCIQFDIGKIKVSWRLDVFSWAAFFTLYFCFLMSARRVQTIHYTILRKRDWSHLLFAPLSTVFVVVWSLFSEIESTSASILDFWHTRRRTFLASSLAYYPNSVAGFRLIRLLSCGDISPNLGPAPNCDKYVCSVCSRSVAHNHRAIQCDVCLCWCHIKCGKVTPAEYTKLASLTVSFPWSCPTFVITTSKNLPFSDVRNPSPGLDLSSDADTSILYESSDSINIVHVQPTPSPNSSLSTCQLPASQDTKVSSGLKGRIINCNGLKGPSRFTEFLVLLDFHKPDIIVGSESKLDWVLTYSVFPPTYSVFTKDRNRNRGGVFQTIESEIVCKDKPNFGKDCEILWSSVKIGNYKTLHLALTTCLLSGTFNQFPLDVLA